MKIQEINAILIVAETGSISSAAQKLYTSQPALSQLIKKVEEELGVSLFIRQTGKKENLKAASLVPLQIMEAALLHPVIEPVTDCAGWNLPDHRLVVPEDSSVIQVKIIIPHRSHVA